MPHGTLTPLGGQLRSVLASIAGSSRPTRNVTLDNHRALGPAASTAGHARRLHHNSVKEASSASAVPQTPVGGQGDSTSYDQTQATDHASVYAPLKARHDASPYHPAHISERPQSASEEARDEQARRFRSISSNHRHRLKRVDHLKGALEDAGSVKALPYSPAKKRFDKSYYNVSSPQRVKNYIARQQRDHGHPENFLCLSLQQILGKLIRHRAKASDYMDAAWNTPFELARLEADFLQHKGVTIGDISAWADIVSEENIAEAAQILATRMCTLGPESVPLFVHLNLLRRKYVSARALRLLINSLADLFRHRAHLGGDREPIVLAVVRLLRHAREVSPQSMQSIVQMLLDHYQHQQDTGQDLDEVRLAATTFCLNQVMSLVSLQTAISPYKDIPLQEANIVSILKFMAQHDPALHINRIGYRAVVRIQLAQRKTESERRWAELKGLSWPPWKVDRDAMDAQITRKEHGCSKAAATLTRMRNAGYAWLDWEKTAQLYAGWDIDGTPTIQMRALLGSNWPDRLTRRDAAEYQPWAARIESTRTIQEAWACYLSWEDAKLSPDQAVYHAIMTKLQLEDRRKQKNIGQEQQDSADPNSWPLFPGDTPDTWPLPHSTHLHTYTRTPPPSLEDFYHMLKARGVDLESDCLALLLECGLPPPLAVEVIKDGISKYPALRSLTRPGGPYENRGIPGILIAALLQYYVESPLAMSVVKGLNEDWKTSRFPPARVVARGFAVEGRSDCLLSSYFPITLAIDILQHLQQPGLPLRVWSSVLKCFAVRNKTFDALFDVKHGSAEQKRKFRQSLDGETSRHYTFLTAFKLVSLIASLMRARGVDLDIEAFHKVCTATDHAASGAWGVLDRAARDGQAGTWVQSGLLRSLNRDAEMIIQDRAKHIGMLRREFGLLVGMDDWSNPPASGETTMASPLALLTTPSPTILHSYVRALGRFGDHDGLLAFARWMREYRHELAERQKQEHRGTSKMRMTMVALRVFLERSWIPKNEDFDAEEQLGGNDENSRALALVRELRIPATEEVRDAVRDVVENVEAWGGWASDEEVQGYTQGMLSSNGASTKR